MDPGGQERRAVAVDVQGVTHRYGARVALADVSFEIRAGELFGLLGPNGGGKSTLFRILATLVPPSEGTALVGGRDVRTEPHAVRRQLGVVFQQPSLDAQLTVAENMRTHGALYGLSSAAVDRRADELLDRLGLTDRRFDFVGTLSGGLARRAEIAKGLLPDPRVLLLDEPSAGLDPVARDGLLEHLVGLARSGDVTVLLTTHHMDEADRCDRIALLDEGRLGALGTPGELKGRVAGYVATLRGPRPDVIAAALEREHATSPVRRGDELRIESDRAYEIVGALLADHREDVDAVTFGKPTLEDAFFHVTGHRLYGDGDQMGDT